MLWLFSTLKKKDKNKPKHESQEKNKWRSTNETRQNSNENKYMCATHGHSTIVAYGLLGILAVYHPFFFFHSSLLWLSCVKHHFNGIRDVSKRTPGQLYNCYDDFPCTHITLLTCAWNCRKNYYFESICSCHSVGFSIWISLNIYPIEIELIL